MDWHKLQHTLFEMDPTDPREDLAKLQQAAQGGGDLSNVPPTKNYLEESAVVAEGSMPLGIDSIADFAALAGVQLNEGPLDAVDNFKQSKFGKAWKAGADNYNKMGAPIAVARAASGESPPKSPDAKTPPGKQKTSGSQSPDEANLSKQYSDFLKQHTEKLQKIATDPKARAEFETWMKFRFNEADERKIKPRDPNWRDMEAIRKSGAAGSHKDKKKLAKQGYSKHKGKQYESIKDMLYAKLAENK